MSNRLAHGWAGVTLFCLCLWSGGCKSRSAVTGQGANVVVPTDKIPMNPGDPGCYKTAGASECPPDLKDPVGQPLPRPGAACHLSVCGVCGSATAPAFRDATGTAQPGWCICVAKSDGSGAYNYSCFTPTEWSSQPR